MSSTAQPASRAELASAWSHALSSTADVPLWPEIGECLRDQADRLLDALHQEPFCPEPVEQAAAALVARGITDDQSLAGTVELLGRVLPTLPELSTVDELTGKGTPLRYAAVTSTSATSGSGRCSTPPRWAW
ncbi:MAG: hypothetical protein M3325_04850 [Actinomycetota bacterium]|nr:hypothetical protein [Actinomycetota bacterium]